MFLQLPLQDAAQLLEVLVVQTAVAHQLDALEAGNAAQVQAPPQRPRSHKRRGLTLAKECMISDSTSESGSVPMALMSASHMNSHIWVRYSGPRT